MPQEEQRLQQSNCCFSLSLTRPRHGGNLDWAAALAGCPSDAILDFSASISPLGPPKSAIAAIQNALSQLAAYPDPNYSSLRQALARMHNLSPDWILPGNGAAELLTWAGWDLSAQDLTFLIVPAFGDYWRCLKAVGANVVPCPLKLSFDNRDFTSQRLPELLSGPGDGSLGLLLNNPHNPTGRLFGREEILPYLEQFALVVVDEAFMDFLPPEEQQSLVEEVRLHPNLVILRSLTKFYSLPGLRLGYAISNPNRIARWQQWRDPWPVNVLAAAAGIAAVQDIEFQKLSRSWLPPARELLFQGLAEIPGLQPYPSAANFLLVFTHCSVSTLQQTLLERHHILIRDCLSFRELGDRYFRVAVKGAEENRHLLIALAEVLS